MEGAGSQKSDGSSNADDGWDQSSSDNEEMIVRHSTRATRPALPAPPIWQKVYDGSYGYLLSVTYNKAQTPKRRPRSEDLR